MSEGVVNDLGRAIMAAGTERIRMGEPGTGTSVDELGARGADGLRERKKAQTRDSLVECALDLFERQGYDTTTIEDIAAAANVSPRTFFRYFDSKLDVVRTPKQDDHPGLVALVALRPADEGAVTAIHAVLRTMLLETLVGDPVAIRLIRVMLTTPSLRAAALDHFHEHTGELAAACAARMGAAPGALAPQVVAAAVGTTLWTVVDRWVAEGAQADRIVPMVDEAFGLLTAGLR
jgi:AcrR family transcriptional regulator